MNFKVDLPKERSSIIKVVGVGGGGGNAVNYMYEQGITGVDFFICNTDNQALELSPIPNKIQIGNELTEGRGAGSNPDVGKKAAEESLEEIIDSLGVNTQMVFVTAGMGGGTGTGAAPVIARAARDMGILTVGIVTTPFMFEGSKRGRAAEEGIEAMRETVDSLLIISNDRIKDMYGNLPISQAFSYADNVLTTAAKGIAEIITIAGSINVDFEDVKTAMKGSGVAIMGNGLAEGDGRALRAAEMALNSPLLNDNKIHGASDLLINISYGADEARMDEYSEINEFFQEQAGMEANLKCGLCYDHSLGNKISVTIIATGFAKKENQFRAVKTDDHIIESVNIVDNVDKDEKADLVNTKQASIFDFINVPEEKEILEANQRVEEMKQRMVHLRQLRQNANTEEGMEEFENIPAYKRRGVKLDSTAHSSESGVSRVSLIDEPEKKPELKSNNSFLHDNVD
ncbi:MAG: cell division protein FtsZ [Bacteroidetes bacterium]|nr:cell division protein FtsZ [Bacteroidota bacterium]